MFRSAAAALLILLFASQLHAQAIDCPATSGSPVSLEAVPSGTFELYAAVDSASVGQPFVLKDAQGRALRTPEVEITLPAAPASLVFATTGAPKRVLVQVPTGCLVYPPGILAGTETGVFNATARVIGTTASFSIPIHVIRTQSYVRRIFPDEVVAGSASPVPADSPSPSVTVSASAEWSDGAGHYGPLGGVPMTFTAPSGGPTLVFANGLQQITVASNSSGGVGAAARTTGGIGPFIVRVTYPDGGLAMVMRYVAIAAPEVQLARTTESEFGVRTQFQGSARFAGFPCNLQFGSLMTTVTIASSNGATLPTLGVRPFDYTCSGDVVQAPFNYTTLGLPFGTWPITVEVGDRFGRLGSGRATTSVTVLPARTVQTATGRGSLRVGSSDPGYFRAAGKCAVNAARSIATTSADFPATRPDAVDLPFGAIGLELGNCTWVSTTDFGIQPPPPPIAQRVLLEADEDLPAGTVAWAYGPTPQNALPHWHALRTSITGRFAQFDVTNGSTGDDSTAADPAIRPLIALGVPARANYQDLWWAGPAENGWGMSLTQHRDALFAALFIYDAQGDPRWLVMSGGAWNAGHTAYSGEVYRPRGTPFAQDGATAFAPGPAIGTLRLTPLDAGRMRLDYTIDGVSGTKEVMRQPFGPVHPYPMTRLDDLWWGGLAQNGWGFALAQQYRTLFGVIYTYDANGDTTWYVAPAGAPQPNSGYVVMESPLYQTRGAPWLGVAYDPSRLAVTKVGTLSMSVHDGWESAFLVVTFDRALPVYKQISRQPF